MRVGLIISVLVVMGLAYLTIYAWHRTAETTREMAQDLVMNAGSVGSETSRATETFDVSGKKRLTIVNDYGSVEIMAGGPKLTIERVVYAGQDNQARARAAQFKVETAPEGADGFRVRVTGEPGRRRASVRLIVQGPPEMELIVQVKLGNGEVSGWRSNVGVTTGSGDLTLKSIAASAAAKTESGNITAENVQGGVVAETGSGNIDLSTVRGHAYGKTGSGDVTMTDVTASDITGEAGSGSVSFDGVAGDVISAATDSGNVEVAVKQPFSGRMQIRAGSGNAELTLPATSDCRVEAKAAAGEISNSLTMRVSAMSNNHLQGTLGNGRGLVQISSGSGNIVLEEAGRG